MQLWAANNLQSPKFNWRACVIRPFEDPNQCIPLELTEKLLMGPGAFTTALNATEFRAEVSPLLSSKRINRFVIFLDQFEDVVWPGAAPGAVDAVREFFKELWQQKDIKPYFRAVVVYRTDVDARLDRLWQQISGKSEGQDSPKKKILPNFASWREMKTRTCAR
jgi:hypothetical protein